jgi:hypothetical protein
MDNLDEVLALYREVPMDNGDAAIFTDLRVVHEVGGLADAWDPVLRRNIGWMLRDTGVREIALAIARPEAELLRQDHAMWADLREELHTSGITVRDPIGLPAAA